MWLRKVQKSLLHNSKKSRNKWFTKKTMLKNYQNFLKTYCNGIYWYVIIVLVQKLYLNKKQKCVVGGSCFGKA